MNNKDTINGSCPLFSKSPKLFKFQLQAVFSSGGFLTILRTILKEDFKVACFRYSYYTLTMLFNYLDQMINDHWYG